MVYRIKQMKKVFFVIFLHGLIGATPPERQPSSPVIAKPVQKGIKINLKVDPTASVADVLAVKRNGVFKFIIPTTPEFTSRFFWQISPWKLKQYKTSYRTEWGRIPTAALVRFIKEGDALFEEFPETRSAYKNAVQKAIDAHKIWFSNQTEENFADLQNKEAMVSRMLESACFSNPFVGAHLKKILETPSKSYFSSFLNLLSLPKRILSSTIKKETGSQVHVFTPRALGMTWPMAGFLIKNILIAVVLAHAIEPNFARLIALIATVKTIYDWKTDTNLTPEPEGGTHVNFTVDYGSYSDDDPSSPF